MLTHLNQQGPEDLVDGYHEGRCFLVSVLRVLDRKFLDKISEGSWLPRDLVDLKSLLHLHFLVRRRRLDFGILELLS